MKENFKLFQKLRSAHRILTNDIYFAMFRAMLNAVLNVMLKILYNIQSNVRSFGYHGVFYGDVKRPILDYDPLYGDEKQEKENWGATTKGRS